MSIDRVQIKGLFDLFDHDLAFRTDEHIMILIGPNGFGKTTTLKLIDALFNESFARLSGIPFREVDVSFDDGTSLTVTRDTEGQLELIAQRDDQRETFRPRVFSNDPTRDAWLRLSRTGRSTGLPGVAESSPYYEKRGAVRDAHDMLGPLPTRPLSDVSLVEDGLPRLLQEILSSVPVRFIDTERLTDTTQSVWHRYVTTGSSPKSPEVSAQRTVTRYSKELGRRLRASAAKYGELSNALDRTFPARLVSEEGRSSAAVAPLQEDLDDIKRRLSQLEEVGLLAPDEHPIEVPDVSFANDFQRGVLEMYARDLHKKLAVFDDLYSRVSTFKRIVNTRFQHKDIAVSSEGLRVVRDDGITLDLESLSSGEQHELVMLYEFLFRASPDSLILLDEPELSLHVAWQEQWLNDLDDTARLSGFRAIVATHSPEIIGRRWALTVELEGPSDR